MFSSAVCARPRNLEAFTATNTGHLCSDSGNEYGKVHPAGSESLQNHADHNAQSEKAKPWTITASAKSEGLKYSKFLQLVL